MAEQALISFKDIWMEYTLKDGVVTVLKNVNFTLHRGSFTIIYGPSGSGKTTILNMLLGLLPPTKGRVVADNVDLYKLNQNQRAQFRATHYGMVTQTNNWVASLNVLENVAVPLYLKGENFDSAKAQAIASLKRVGLEQYAKYSPSVLSIGQQQRISMARATIEAPQLLVADEPTGNLDSKNGDMVMKLMTEFKNHQKATIILVTHNLDYLPLSDHRLFIKDGELTEDTGGYLPESLANSAALQAVTTGPGSTKKGGK